MRLYTLILAQLRQSPDVVSSLYPPSTSEHTVEDAAAKVLDRVKIMRVFDFVGVKEAVGEVRDGLEGRRTVPNKVEIISEPLKQEKRPPTPPKRTFVADSEDEDEEEMLFDEAFVTEDIPILEEPEADKSNNEEEPQSKVKFILIDNLAQVLNPLLKKDYVQGARPYSKSSS